ncbi:stress responsive protein [Devosia pacifica]|uniref:Stress responsive protein n=1 Tax=Devosia pacifica TaxID=1335967 RepID=A0A918SFT8_9HYPH|nr:Dabb family protein [Devosia pacifica]GHA36374.1 stress responsive protein [Devosia pacifica]
MIRHCVFVKFRPDITSEERQSIFRQLADLRETVDGIVAVHFGANVSPEGLAKGFAHGFIMDFASAEARDAYLVHPDHKAAGGRLVAALEGGRDGLMVFDMEI